LPSFVLTTHCACGDQYMLNYTLITYGFIILWSAPSHNLATAIQGKSQLIINSPKSFYCNTS